MKMSFPWLALGIGLLVALVLLQGGALGEVEAMRLPLLTMLIVNEFGFFVTVAGVALGGRDLKRQGMRLPLLLATLGCGLLTLLFVVLGVVLWPGQFPVA